MVSLTLRKIKLLLHLILLLERSRSGGVFVTILTLSIAQRYFETVFTSQTFFLIAQCYTVGLVIKCVEYQS